MIRKIGFLVIALISVVGLMPASVALAGSPDVATSDHTVIANQEQLKLIQELYGKPITVAEYFGKVYPDELKKMLKELPKGMDKYLYETEMQWAPLPGQPTSEGAVAEEARPRVQGQSYSQGEAIDQVLSMYTQLDYAWSTYGYVHHGARMWTIPPTYMPYITCQSNLWFWSNNQWNLIWSVQRALASLRLFEINCKQYPSAALAVNSSSIQIVSAGPLRLMF